MFAVNGITGVLLAKICGTWMELKMRQEIAVIVASVLLRRPISTKSWSLKFLSGQLFFPPCYYEVFRDGYFGQERAVKRFPLFEVEFE
jgi:hypothetical protein